MKRKWYMLVVFAALILLLSGCNLGTVKEMYRVPIRSEAYQNLQKLIDEVMTDAQYSAPLSGTNLQTVQMADLDGDEFVEYLLFSKTGSDKPLRISIFSVSQGGYALVDTIECSGAAFDQVEYAQIDGLGGLDIIVGRQIGEQVVRTLSVYSMHDGQMEQILSTNYSKFLRTDLDENGRSELFVLRPAESASENGIAELYTVRNGIMSRSPEVQMTRPVESIKKVMVSMLYNDVPAVYVASDVDGSAIVTDVFSVVNGQLANVTKNGEHDTNVNTLRNYYVYADDIDADGVLELPDLMEMRMPEGTVGTQSQHLIRWYALTSLGEVVDKLYTYHNYVGGWYLRLTESYVDRLTVSQQGNSYIFSIWNEDYTLQQPLMTIYVLTGQNREEQAVMDNRFVLLRTEGTVYAASLEVVSVEHGLSQHVLINNFELIREEWNPSGT